MSWLFNRRKRETPSAVPRGLETGSHRSPGFAVICRELERFAEPRVLDLGRTSTENLEFLSRYGSQVAVADLFRSCGGVEGERPVPFRFPPAASLPLPDGDGPFDVILVWDLLHYLERSELAGFTARLRALSRAGTWVFFTISTRMPIPATPIHFRIETTELLHYGIVSATRLPAPQYTPREVEKVMTGYVPERSFQLRSGLQELLFQHEG